VTEIASLAGGAALGEVDLIYVPEPTAPLLAVNRVGVCGSRPRGRPLRWKNGNSLSWRIRRFNHANRFVPVNPVAGREHCLAGGEPSCQERFIFSSAAQARHQFDRRVPQRRPIVRVVSRLRWSGSLDVVIRELACGRGIRLESGFPDG
jgi:hypothetical protein